MDESQDVDILICDTSGRLHTNFNLMEELAKCKRSISKRLGRDPHEVLLVLDGKINAPLGEQRAAAHRGILDLMHVNGE